ncbi:hypothetical protein DAPPUDRAFT_266188 [Daphnia pulex]|uniref:Uncharacterized protein n=1 Tax=Daphnia pulex TaxID=6669 RepID=E9HUM0_DAPPU|nr:hypothetical protein DAPPUDRAFT_266188 [Daphnia pulex]|eukprot:EFX64561.1 hypothetical protein DAPPUDRAFT_266188 [Daphnia pulex]
MHMHELPGLILIQRLSPPFGVSSRDSSNQRTDKKRLEDFKINSKEPLDGKELSYDGNETTTNAEPDNFPFCVFVPFPKAPRRYQRASGGKELSYDGNETTTNAEPDNFPFCVFVPFPKAPRRYQTRIHPSPGNDVTTPSSGLGKVRFFKTRRLAHSPGTAMGTGTSPNKRELSYVGNETTTNAEPDNFPFCVFVPFPKAPRRYQSFCVEAT